MKTIKVIILALAVVAGAVSVQAKPVANPQLVGRVIIDRQPPGISSWFEIVFRFGWRPCWP